MAITANTLDISASSTLTFRQWANNHNKSVADLRTMDGGKAANSYVNTQLATKAANSYVNTQLATKAANSYVNTELATKAANSYVNSTFATKAYAAANSYVNTQLATKAANSYVNTELATKAANSYVNTQLATKANTATTITASTGLTGGGSLAANRTIAIDKASNTNVQAAANNKVFTTDAIKNAADFKTITFANPLTLDWGTFINGTTTATSNFTLNAPSAAQPGTWRRLIITQDATGSRTLSFEANRFKAPGGLSSVVLSTAANSIDTLDIFCRSTTDFWVYLNKDHKA